LFPKYQGVKFNKELPLLIENIKHMKEAKFPPETEGCEGLDGGSGTEGGRIKVAAWTE
jgi:hypothetical protein